MKKLSLGLIVVLLLAYSTVQLKAAPESGSSPENISEIVESDEIYTLLARLDEIKTLDKSVMSPSEKKELRKEVRSIKNELKELGAGG
jgi:hypothetical protein